MNAKYKRFGWVFKRLLDLMTSLVGLLVLAPVLLLLALLVRLDSNGPVLYRQNRLGIGGQRFVLLKFRSMRSDAEQLLGDLLEKNPDSRKLWDDHQKLFTDPRLTRLGGFLRRSSLDELPQLWNVIKGEMSLVGPRPILPEQAEEYRSHNCYYGEMPPGLTGLWQISGRNALPFSERARLDQQYADEWSLALDLRILLRTFGIVLRGDGAF
jgi:undecaprenyl-phosphate galactose phosphotransferase